MPKLFFLTVFALLSFIGFSQDQKWKKWEVEADTLMNHQDFEGALKLYTKVIKASKLKDKAAFPSLYKRAVCNYSIGQYDAALEDLRIFIPEYPSLYQARILKAFIYRDLDNSDEQLKALNEALAVNPGDPGLIKWRASLYLSEEKYDSVKEDMMYVKSVQDDPEVEMYLGFAYYNLEEKDSAFESLNKAIELDATYLPAYLYGGSFSLQDGDNEKALKYLNVALRIDPSNVSAMFYKGIALIELKKEDEGCSMLSKAFYAGEDDAGDYLKEYCYDLSK